MPEKDEELAQIGEKLQASRQLVIRNIQLTKCMMLSPNKLYILRDWSRVLCGVAFIKKLRTYVFEHSSNPYELWGLVRKDGYSYDTFLLLTPVQSADLEMKFHAQSSPTTIQILPYTEADIKDLSDVLYLGGEKFPFKMGHAYNEHDECLKYFYPIGFQIIRYR